MPSTLKKILTVLGVSAVVGVIVGVGVWVGSYLAGPLRDGSYASAFEGAQSGSALVTAPVEYAALPNDVKVNGTLTYGVSVPLSAVPGMLTWLPNPGATIEVGQQVYEANGKPVTLMVGTRPFWRELTGGVSGADSSEGSSESSSGDCGEDVRQLQQNLMDLGFYEGIADGDFAEETLQAVKEWQQSLGYEETGIFDPATVVVVEAPPIRVDQVTGKLGEVGTSPLSYTSPTEEVHAALRAGQESAVSPGQAAEVLFANGQVVPGRVKEVLSGSSPADSAPGSPDGSAETAPTLVVSLPDSESLPGVPGASVQITLASLAPAQKTLLVPVAALLATDVDKYVVEVLQAENVVRIEVTVGQSANGKVQVFPAVEGTLHEGDQVVIS